MATIKDVARLAGVSPSTISKFINGGNVLEENADAIRKAIAELDYRVNPFARNLKTQRSRAIGILLPDMTAPYFGSVITAMDKIFRENGFHTLVSCYSSNHGLERDNLQFLISNGIDGLIYVPEDLTAEEFQELTSSSRIPTVQFDRVIPGISGDCVLVNNADAIYTAVSRLILKGHKRIAIVAGSKSVYSSRERLVGYLRALSDHQIFYDDALVISGSKAEFATGYRGFISLMKLKNPPTAILGSNYNITIGLITAARERGYNIPKDLDIFGFDSAEICRMMKPAIPVVQQPEEEIGRTAAKLLIDRLNGSDAPPRTIRLDCKIIADE